MPILYPFPEDGFSPLICRWVVHRPGVTHTAYRSVGCCRVDRSCFHIAERVITCCDADGGLYPDGRDNRCTTAMQAAVGMYCPGVMV